MGNYSTQNYSTSVNSPNDDFNNSYLDIYLFGNYNPIMEIIIGDEKGKDDYIQKYESKKNEDYISIRPTPTDEDYNTLNERLINKNNNDSKENNIEYEIDFDTFLNNFKTHKEEILSKEPYKIKNSIFNWNLNFYKNFDDLSKVKDIFENNFYKEQKNVLIIFIDNLKTIYKVIKIFDMIYNEIHPLFLFVINKKKIKVKKTEILNELNNYIKNNRIKRFNLRNITLLEEVDLNETPQNEELNNLNKKKSDYIFELYFFLINSWLYYNNLGDNFEFGSHLGKNSNEFLKTIDNEKKNININSHVGLFNIIVLGRPGTGKSTLINILSNQKRSLEGRGESVTKKMIKYIIKDYNISLYDTPGFELDKDINEIIQFINNVQKHLIQRKNQINMAFYLITEGARDFYDNEKKILKILMEYNIPIFFLLTFSRNLEKGQEFKEIVEINLRRTLKLLDKNKGMAYYNSKIKVFPVHLLDENDGSCNNFGIKTVMEAAFDKFKHCIIEEEELGYFNDIRDDYQKEISDDRPNRIREIFNLLEGKEIYKYFKDIDDILSCSISESESVISYYLKVFFALNILFPSFLLMKSIKTNLLKAILDKFKKVIDNKEKEELIQNNLKEIKDYNLFKSHCPFYNLFYNYKNIRDFGNKYIKIFTEELKNAGIDGLSKFIKEFLLDYNNAINGLKEIGKNFNE
jgi:small GTP-binding protein